MVAMFRALIDTCVWLDLAKEHRHRPMLDALERLVEMGDIDLILPRVIFDEFERNKSRIAEASARSMSTALRRAREIVDILGQGRGKRVAVGHLEEIEHRLPQLGDAAVQAIGRIDTLFAATEVVEVSDEVMLRAARRAVDRRAPFHRQRNSMDDAILFEIYCDHAAIRGAGIRYAFITHNTKDFSTPAGDTRVPHPDLAPAFSRIRSLYATELGGFLRRVNPAVMADVVVDHEWSLEPRRLGEILGALDELTDKVWYGRHGLLHAAVESGKVKVVDEDDYKHDPYGGTLRRDIWRGARTAARRVERKYGIENLGPWDSFEWGMLSGKLSALRWVMGDDWDMLDT